MPASYQSAEDKLYSLASQDAAMQSIFQGVGSFRWFNVQLPQGYVVKGTCCRVRRISAVYQYTQGGLLCIEGVRFQIDCLDTAQTKARAALNAITTFMGTVVDLMNPGQFTSPPSGPLQFANFLLSQRSLIEFQVEKQIYVESADWRLLNNLTAV